MAKISHNCLEMAVCSQCLVPGR